MHHPSSANAWKLINFFFQNAKLMTHSFINSFHYASIFRLSVRRRPANPSLHWLPTQINSPILLSARFSRQHFDQSTHRLIKAKGTSRAFLAQQLGLLFSLDSEQLIPGPGFTSSVFFFFQNAFFLPLLFIALLFDSIRFRLRCSLLILASFDEPALRLTVDFST